MTPWRAPMPSVGEPFVLRSAAVPSILLDDGLAADTSLVDIGVAKGSIQFVAFADAQTSCDWRTLPMAGAMAWPCFVEAHTHLDSTQLWARAPNPDGTFVGAAATIIADRDRFWTAEDMRTRMEFGLRCAYAHGVRAMRTHLASENDQAEERWRVFCAIRDGWRGRIDLQAVSLVSTELFRDQAMAARIAALVKQAGGVLGAYTPLTPDIDTLLELIFDLADKYDLALDFHADETGDPASDALARIASVAKARRFARPILAGHCCSLAVQGEVDADRTLGLVADAGISIVTLPSCNLYLQDRRAGRTPRWRGLTLLKEMRAHGIDVAFGSDNCRDPFHPYGDFDMLETFRDAVRIGHLEHPIRDWPASVTSTAAKLIGVTGGGIVAGGSADMVLFRARSFGELLARPQADRILIRDGAFVSAAPPDYEELDALFERTAR